MSLTDRVQLEIDKLKKRGSEADIIWLGRSERREVEEGADLTKFGLPVMFVSSFNWLSITVKETYEEMERKT